MTIDSLFQNTTRSGLDDTRQTLKHGLPVHRYGSVHSVHQVVFGRTPDVVLWQNGRTFSSLANSSAYIRQV